jgi:hypothetical protein
MVFSMYASGHALPPVYLTALDVNQTIQKLTVIALALLQSMPH